MCINYVKQNECQKPHLLQIHCNRQTGLTFVLIIGYKVIFFLLPENLYFANFLLVDETETKKKMKISFQFNYHCVVKQYMSVTFLFCNQVFFFK